MYMLRIIPFGIKLEVSYKYLLNRGTFQVTCNRINQNRPQGSKLKFKYHPVLAR